MGGTCIMLKKHKLVILEYSTGRVHTYFIDPSVKITDEYVENLGYRMSDCYYMHGAVQFIEHQEMLK